MTLTLPHLINIESELYNCASHRFRYWRFSECIKVESHEPFYKNDVVYIDKIDGDVVKVTPVMSVQPVRALILAAPDIPLDKNSQFEFQTNNCEILLQRSVEHRGNLMYLMAVSADLKQRSTVIGYDQRTRTRISFTFGN